MNTVTLGSLFDGIGVFPHLYYQTAFPRYGAFGGHHKAERRVCSTCPCADFWFSMSKPFTDWEPYRPGRCKIQPVFPCNPNY